MGVLPAYRAIAAAQPVSAVTLGAGGQVVMPRLADGDIVLEANTATRCQLLDQSPVYLRGRITAAQSEKMLCTSNVLLHDHKLLKCSHKEPSFACG